MTRGARGVDTLRVSTILFRLSKRSRMLAGGTLGTAARVMSEGQRAVSEGKRVHGMSPQKVGMELENGDEIILSIRQFCCLLLLGLRTALRDYDCFSPPMQYDHISARSSVLTSSDEDVLVRSEKPKQVKALISDSPTGKIGRRPPSDIAYAESEKSKRRKSSLTIKLDLVNSLLFKGQRKDQL
jgi:hypothetical protein